VSWRSMYHIGIINIAVFNILLLNITSNYFYDPLKETGELYRKLVLTKGHVTLEKKILQRQKNCNIY
jgi:hypothetical protein